MSKKTANKDSAFFWNNASKYLNNELPNISKKALNDRSLQACTKQLYFRDRKINLENRSMLSKFQ